MNLNKLLIPLLSYLFPLFAIPYISPSGLVGMAIRSSAESYTSHRFLKSELEKDLNPETALLRRLGLLRELEKLHIHNQNQALKKQLTELSKRLLEDPDFLKSLQARYSKNDIDKMISSINRTDNIEFPSDWIKELKAKLGESKINSAESEKVMGLIEKLQDKENKADLINQKNESSSTNKWEKAKTNPSQTESKNTETPRWDNLELSSQDWIKKQSELWVPTLQQWLQSPSGKSLSNFFISLSKNWEKTGQFSPAITRKMSGISRFLPRLSPFISRTSLNQIPKIITPSSHQYRIKGIHFSNLKLTSKSIAIMFLLACFLTLSYVLLSKFQRSFFRAKSIANLSYTNLHLVSPYKEINSRKDLAKAFEDFSFLLLGSEIKTKNHFVIARKLEIIPSFDPERTREAIDFLVHHYEQARYCPENELFQDEIFRRASRELRFLAGEIY